MRVLLEEYKDRPDITLIQAAANGYGPNDTQERLIEMEITDYPVSTSDHSVHSLWKDAPGTKYLRKMLVSQITILDLLCSSGLVNFISIDAEGQSVSIAKRLLQYDGLLPQCFCVEHDGNNDEIKRLAEAKGYTKFHLTSENLIAAR
jgi:hypothetical protein